MELYKQISERVDKESENIIKFLCEYINHKSINPDRAFSDEPGNVYDCQRWLKEKLDKMDIYDKVDFWEEEKKRPNIVCVICGDGTGRSIMFNGHTDVAPLTEKQYSGWTKGYPWKARVIDSKVYGRGASDMKGGITSFLWAIKVLKDLKIPIRGDIIVAINIGEESENTEIGSRSVVKRGYRAPLLINAEPTNLEICPATIGWFFFKVTVLGKTAHLAYNRQSLYPTEFGNRVLGVNAIEKMDIVLNAFRRLNCEWGMHRKHPLAPPGSMNLCLVSIKGGKYYSSIPESCEAIYAVSFNPDLKSKEVIKEIKDLIKNIASTDYWLKDGHIKLEIPYLEIDKNVVEPINIPKTHRGCIALSKAYREIMKVEPNFTCFPAVCDANSFFELGIPSIIFGPGDLSMGTHAENEYVPIEHVINATKIYANLIIKWWDLN